MARFHSLYSLEVLARHYANHYRRWVRILGLLAHTRLWPCSVLAALRYCTFSLPTERPLYERKTVMFFLLRLASVAHLRKGNREASYHDDVLLWLLRLHLGDIEPSSFVWSRPPELDSLDCVGSKDDEFFKRDPPII